MTQAEKFEMFKAVIIDLVNNRSQRPAPIAIDPSVDENMDADGFIKQYYCAQPFQDRFIVTRFLTYYTENKIVIEYENSAAKWGAIVGYDYTDDGTVTYARMLNEFEFTKHEKIVID
jgi:hypothetical protein